MKQLASLNFLDLVEKCRVYVGTRVGKGVVAVAVSREVDGDVEVCVTPNDARAIAWALEAAAKRAEETSP
jgi:hypothetical protein